MTPEPDTPAVGGATSAPELAALHAAAFRFPRPWSAAEIAALLAAPHVFALCEGARSPQGFVLGRAVTGEAELLTLAVHPGHRRQGLARGLLARFDAAALDRGAREAFLEVAADNAGAIALYRACGWQAAGRRRAYYRGGAGGAVDALVLRKALAAA
ncbi:GNAT family N-acetyltransferase [Brevirhabdus sp.]|uniref:GNAT family N-acetyltransferase n=1 Tax=Brevirhabdus sp. TaxID=2004514 RepID=UPI004059090F